MNIVVIGSGYVGLVTAACLAESGHLVNCIDIDKEKLNNLKKGDIPFFEIGLKKIVLKAVKTKHYAFRTAMPILSIKLKLSSYA